jgi:hypothetical protein
MENDNWNEWATEKIQRRKISKKNAVLTQIKFHKNVLKSKGDSKLFAFSSVQNKKRVQHKVEILIENLAKIIEMNPVNTTNIFWKTKFWW